MNPIALLAVALGAIAVLCLLLVLSQLWGMGGQAEERVGRLHAARPDRPPPPLVPAKFRSLIGGEATSWRTTREWAQVAADLDMIEHQLGGDSGTHPAPEKYSAAWLEQRVARIEEIAGPLPSPMSTSQKPPPTRRFWKRP